MTPLAAYSIARRTLAGYGCSPQCPGGTYEGSTMSAGLIEARPWTGSERTRSPCSPGRIVVQAWLASRGLILAVALVLAVVQHRSLSDMVSNWDVQHFAKLAA